MADEVTNYNVTAMCDECHARVKGAIVGRDGDDPEPLLMALANGWDTLHAGHQQIVIASARG